MVSLFILIGKKKQKWPLIVSRKFTIKGHSSCSLISNIFLNPLFLLSTPKTLNLFSITKHSIRRGESTFDIWACTLWGDGPVFSSKEIRIRLYINSFLSDSNLYRSHLLRSDFSRWINLWEKNNLLFHRFVPSFLCDLIISHFFRENNWHSVWTFSAFFVQWGELYCKNEIRGLQVHFFVIYCKCWGLVIVLFFAIRRNNEQKFNFWFIVEIVYLNCGAFLQNRPTPRKTLTAFLV